MDIHFSLNHTDFVWNADKAALNKNKHGVSFEQAATAFFDPLFKLVDASANQESRDAVIGYDEFNNLLFVVHVEIEEEFIRIISARKATATERNYYDS